MRVDLAELKVGLGVKILCLNEMVFTVAEVTFAASTEIECRSHSNFVWPSDVQLGILKDPIVMQII